MWQLPEVRTQVKDIDEHETETFKVIIKKNGVKAQADDYSFIGSVRKRCKRRIRQAVAGVGPSWPGWQVSALVICMPFHDGILQWLISCMQEMQGTF